MKRRHALLSLLPCAGVAAQEPSRMGLHGMALFGGAEGLYASHLPMFHAPHDVQLLLRIRLQDALLDQQLRSALAARPELWTIEPERFDLSRLHTRTLNPLRQFGARLVQGHFERGGQERQAQVQVAVEQVLLFNRLLPDFRQGAFQRFFWLGQGREQFLVKWLDQRPDIDLIGRFINRKPLTRLSLLTLPAGPLAAPQPQTLLNALRQAGARAAGTPQWLYTETGDLA